jgi:hypothetical protein
MRYYAIRFTNPKTGQIYMPNYGGKPGFTLVDFKPTTYSYTSLYQGGSVSTLGSTNPSALQFECDIPVAALDAPIANAYFRIDGVSLQEIAQATNLVGANVSIAVGMAKGLPLANFGQAGTIVQAQVGQCFGNWIGTSQHIDCYVWAGGDSPSANMNTGGIVTSQTIPIPISHQSPANIVFQWQPGQPLMLPLSQTLQTAFPQYTIQGAVSPNLVWVGTAATGFYSTLTQFAQYIKNASLNLIGGFAPNQALYPGVSIVLQNGTIWIYDGTQQPKPKQINFTDLVGQPSLVGINEVQVTCAMRGDIKVGDYVTLPGGLVEVTQSSLAGRAAPPSLGSINTASSPGNSPYTGTYQVINVRHVGNSRDPGGLSWVTTINVLLTQSFNKDVQVTSFPNVYQPGPNTYGFSVPM